MYVVAITGASGAIIGIRLIEELISAKKNVSTIVSNSGWKTIDHELCHDKEKYSYLKDLIHDRNASLDLHSLKEYAPDDFFSPLASGSTPYDALIIAPTSMKTLAAIAHGYADNLITRTADVALKEGRDCILIPRETPLSLIHLENLLKVKQAGASIVPPMPGFYAHPQSIDDVINFIVGKVLNLLKIEHSLLKSWGEDS